MVSRDFLRDDDILHLVRTDQGMISVRSPTVHRSVQISDQCPVGPWKLGGGLRTEERGVRSGLTGSPAGPSQYPPITKAIQRIDLNVPRLVIIQAGSTRVPLVILVQTKRCH